MVNINAPIIPYVGMGGITFDCTKEELHELLSGAKLVWDNGGVTRYDIEDAVSLFILNTNGKLYRLMTLEGYKGKLFDKISTATTEKEMLALEPSFVFEPFEEVFVSEKGVFIETDIDSTLALYISVYVKEMDQMDPVVFDKGKW